MHYRFYLVVDAAKIMIDDNDGDLEDFRREFSLWEKHVDLCRSSISNFYYKSNGVVTAFPGKELRQSSRARVVGEIVDGAA